jgi:hypothetical protein
MRFNSSIEKRVARLEGRAGVCDAVLHFADGSTRAVTVRNALALFCAACARASYYLGPPEKSPRSKDFDFPAPRPASPYDNLIDLFGTAERVESTDNFLYTVQTVCQTAIEEGGKHPSKSERKLAHQVVELEEKRAAMPLAT